MKLTPELNGPAFNANSFNELRSVFTTLEKIGLLAEHTNSAIITKNGTYAPTFRTNVTNDVEMKSLIGLLMLAGTYQANRLNLEDMWSNDGSGIEMFRLPLSQKCFRFLLCCLRFHDKATSEKRKKVNKLVLIRQIIEMFVEDCKKNYSPSKFVTIDERSPVFRSRAAFRQYIPSKPAKYGV